MNDEISFPAILPSYFGILTLSMLPLLIVMGTAFTKISIVLMMLRNALGVQQAPSGLVINSLALTLTIFIMVPVADELIINVQERNLNFQNWEDAQTLFSIISDGFSTYLQKHTTDRELAFFIDAAKQMWPSSLHEYANKDNLLLLLPAHVTSEITRAFQIAFLLFLPFVIIDMVVSNVLLALGAMMVPPMLISLPVKLLLFVAVDGWAQLLHALMISYM